MAEKRHKNSKLCKKFSKDFVKLIKIRKCSYVVFKRKKRIVLIGEKKSPNLGDSVICSVAEYLFSTIHPSYMVALYDVSIARRPESKIGAILSRLFSIRLKHEDLFLYWYTFFYYFGRIGYGTNVCIISGALFQNFFSQAIVAIIDVCRIKQAKLHFTGTGVGILSLKNKQKIKHALSRLKWVDLKIRDGLTFFSSEISPLCRFTPDIAICSSVLYKGIEKSGEYVGFGIISPDHIANEKYFVSKESYLNECCRCIKALLSQGEKIALFTNGDYGDYYMAKEIYTVFDKSKNVILLDRPRNDVELIAFFNHFKYVISSRLHSLIIAFSFELPSIALSWDNKVLDFESYSKGCSSICNIREMRAINWESEVTRLYAFDFDKSRLDELKKQIINNIKNIIT